MLKKLEKIKEKVLTIYKAISMLIHTYIHTYIHIVKKKKQKDPKAFILSADIPSAVSADTGETSFDENGERICIQSDAVIFLSAIPGPCG